MSDEQPPEESPEEEAARTRASAEGAAGDLARMGIDPRALGLQAPPEAGPAPPGTAVPPGSPGTAAGPPPPASPALQPSAAENVVQLRPDVDQPDLPASGTSPAWAPTPPPVAQEPTTAPARPTPLEPLIGGAEALEQPRSAPAQLARAVTYGIITPDAADAAEREREMVNRVRTRQTDQRVVVFLSGKGGVGTTTVAVGVGCVLAALRDDLTTVASIRRGTPSIGLSMAGTRAPTARDLGRTDTEVTPLRLEGGLQVVDGPRWGAPVRRNDVPTIVDRLGQTSMFTLFDVGNDSTEAGSSVISRADQVVIVSGSGADSVDAARVAAERAAEIDPYLVDSAVFVVVCQREAALRGVLRRMRETMPAGARVVAVPPEATLAAGAAFDAARVTAATRLALIDVAGLVALGSVAGRRSG
ncbi:MAG: hypothetical protein ACRDQA_32275 [Nocardioidaceae bacterium]